MFVFYSAECYIDRTVVQSATISLAFGDCQNYFGDGSSLSFVDGNSKAWLDRKKFFTRTLLHLYSPFGNPGTIIGCGIFANFRLQGRGMTILSGSKLRLDCSLFCWLLSDRSISLTFIASGWRWTGNDRRQVCRIVWMVSVKIQLNFFDILTGQQGIIKIRHYLLHNFVKSRVRNCWISNVVQICEN